MSTFPRRDVRFAVLLAALLGALAILVTRASAQDRREARALVSAHALTDLCLATEARYTRHPTQADRHAAFQDHPGAREHFPTGALIPPRAHGRP